MTILCRVWISTSVLPLLGWEYSSVKCLLLKRADLHLIPRTHIKSQAQWSLIIIQYLIGKPKPERERACLKSQGWDWRGGLWLKAEAGVVMHTFNFSTPEAEAGRPLLVRGKPGQAAGQPGPHKKKKPCLIKQSKQNKTSKTPEALAVVQGSKFDSQHPHGSSSTRIFGALFWLPLVLHAHGAQTYM